MTITHIHTALLHSSKFTIRVNGRNGGYVFGGNWCDPQNSTTRKYKAEIEAYIAANIVAKATNA